MTTALGRDVNYNTSIICLNWRPYCVLPRSGVAALQRSRGAKGTRGYALEGCPIKKAGGISVDLAFLCPDPEAILVGWQPVELTDECKERPTPRPH
jgi:hypothetical protein